MASTKINPLLCYFHAVEIPEIYKNFYEIPCDKYDIAYFKYPYGQRIAEALFRKYTEYTHLVLVANDMIATKQAFNILVQDLEKHDYPIISGMVNVDQHKLKDYWNVCTNVPNFDYYNRKYRWLPESSRKLIAESADPVMRCKFSGFPMMFIRRDILEKIRINILDPKFKNNAPALWDRKGGYANDVCFANNCHINNIPMYADTRATMFHYGLKGKQKVGINKPRLNFIKYEAK